MVNRIRLATRQSSLAMWQANHVKAKLEIAHPGLVVEIVGMTTEGDRNKHSPLSQMGGKGVFVKELESALIEGRADIAVHSMKDVPAQLPADLQISAICEREDPRDALVCTKFNSFSALPAGARIGSSSLRRRLQLKQARADLLYQDLRGNVGTRINKLDEGLFDGIILAAAGLKRLGLAERITESISTAVSIPAAGQGAVGIECSANNVDVIALLQAINHVDSFECVSCEREISTGLGANCNLPIAAYAELDKGQMSLATYISDADGKHSLRLSANGERQEGIEMARNLIEKLLSQGARELISTHS
ncbi:MAG: hydroxymethylbilane synthase [Pseudomonadales bacterium]|nr:hydroxymethylbilane synthase [Pseudomonadales bacterium]